MAPRLPALVVVTLAVGAGGCVIQGYDSGVCEEYALAGFKGQLDFCSDHVTYRACMPVKPPSSSAELLDHNAIEKDKWVKEQYDVITEWYAGNHTVASQEGMADCMAAFKNFLCWYNFPRCSPLDVSLVMCRSVCDNMMTACGIATSSPMWRCGDPQFMNGAGPEVSTAVDTRGYKVWKRDFFPGQPFRDYRETDEQEPIVVCTPSILGAAGGLHSAAAARAALLASLLAALLAVVAAAGCA